MSIEDLRRKLQNENLPIDPIIGETDVEVAKRLVRLAERISKFGVEEFPGKGSTRTSFVVKPSSEYDFQDLFWIASKPWVQSIDREQVEIVFDHQMKKSDFSINGSRFIIEMKFAKDKNSKRGIAKTLEGLAKFYSENSNVRILMFIIYASRAAEIDSTLWEGKFSRLAGRPRVLVKVVQLDR